MCACGLCVHLWEKQCVRTPSACSAVQSVTLLYCSRAIPGQGESDRRRGHAERVSATCMTSSFYQLKVEE